MAHIDVAIIGSGPAGMASGIYAARKNLKVRVLEKKIAGGYTADSVLVENYPGFKAIKGIELAMKIQSHLESFGVKAEEGIEVKSAKQSEGKFELELSTGEKLEAKTLILATGTTHKKLGAKNAEKLEGNGIHYCATCDGPLYKDKTVAVIGGGNSGVTNALFLADICKKVFLLEYGEELKADSVYCPKLEEKGVEVVLNAEVFELLGEETVSGLKYRDRESKEEKELKLDAVFVYIGLVPNSGIAKELGCELNEYSYIKVNKDMSTTVKGVFAAGDITGGFAQSIVAAGQGAVAAESAYQHIKGGK